MIDLRNTTFIIPIYIESEDRAKNLETVIKYLTKHFDTNIIICEWASQTGARLLNSLGIYAPIKHYLFRHAIGDLKVFHRTLFLNEMLRLVKTPVVVNYDIDILLAPDVYKECERLILSGKDLVYPYFWGNSQYKVNYSGRDKINKTLDLNCLEESDKQIERSEYGHCQFFNSASYREGGMEDENFISYGPEDKWRGLRFQRLGYNVMWAEGYVYHLEHSRGINSSSENPYIQKNNELFLFLDSLSEEQIKIHYKNQDYLKKYK